MSGPMVPAEESGGIGGAMGGRTASALSKRADQLKKWEESETNRETDEFKENSMLSDALELLHNDNPAKVWPKHPLSGATPLRVASAKGYIKVMNILLQAGHPVDVQDSDGWTPLHVAAGEKQACETLVEHSARMDVRNTAGHTCFDLADEKVIPVLEELAIKVAERTKENVPTDSSDRDTLPHTKRLSSGSAASAKGHLKSSPIAKDDILMETRVRSSASESDSDAEIVDADEVESNCKSSPGPAPLILPGGQSVARRKMAEKRFPWKRSRLTSSGPRLAI